MKEKTVQFKQAVVRVYTENWLEKQQFKINIPESKKVIDHIIELYDIIDAHCEMIQQENKTNWERNKQINRLRDEKEALEKTIEELKSKRKNEQISNDTEGIGG